MEHNLEHLTGLRRALALIELLSLYPRGVSIADLARETGLPKSTIHRLLQELIETGYATRTGEGLYGISFKVCELSSRVLAGLDIIEVSAPIIKSFCSRIRETVHLVAPSGTDIVYLRKEVFLGDSFGMMSYIGMRRPMYCTAAGKSILCGYEDEQVRDLWRSSGVQKITANTIVHLPEFMEDIRHSRERGYAIDDEENEVGVKCVACSIKSYGGVPAGAISISASANKMTPEHIRKLAAEIQKAAGDISARLGYKKEQK